MHTNIKNKLKFKNLLFREIGINALMNAKDLNGKISMNNYSKNINNINNCL